MEKSRLVFSTDNTLARKLGVPSLDPLSLPGSDGVDSEIQETLEEQQNIIKIHTSTENLCYGRHKDNPSISDTQRLLPKEYNGGERDPLYFSVVKGANLERRRFDYERF